TLDFRVIKHSAARLSFSISLTSSITLTLSRIHAHSLRPAGQQSRPTGLPPVHRQYTDAVVH
ncbi:hypothetical protein SOVF_167630, partial [Spinacia oleracea]